MLVISITRITLHLPQIQRLEQWSVCPHPGHLPRKSHQCRTSIFLTNAVTFLDDEGTSDIFLPGGSRHTSPTQAESSRSTTPHFVEQIVVFRDSLYSNSTSSAGWPCPRLPSVAILYDDCEATKHHVVG